MNVLYAGLRIRVLAFGLDYLLIAAYLTLLVAISIAVNLIWPELASMFFTNPVSGHSFSLLLVTIPVSLYFVLSEASPKQATWGKRKMGLRVIPSDGKGMGIGRSFGRTALKFVPWELAHFLIWQVRFAEPSAEALITAGFFFVWVLIGANLVRLLFSRPHQTFYDWLAGTYVIRQQ